MNHEHFNIASRGPLRLGEFLVDSRVNEINRHRVEPKTMDVLMALVDASPELLSTAMLLNRVWPNVVVSDSVVHQAVSHLRKVLQDCASAPRFIEHVPRRGYRLLAAIDLSEPQGEWHAPKADAIVRNEQPLLAVLAFDTPSGDDDMARFSEGLSEGIQLTLACAARLKVIGCASSFRFRGADKAAAHVAAELNVTHVLDGSVRRSGTQVRISMQLIECASETALWATRFDRALSDVFTVQDQIATEVADALTRVAFAANRAVRLESLIRHEEC